VISKPEARGAAQLVEMGPTGRSSMNVDIQLSSVVPPCRRYIVPKGLVILSGALETSQVTLCYRLDQTSDDEFDKVELTCCPAYHTVFALG
jgi:hypothetical protein